MTQPERVHPVAEEALARWGALRSPLLAGLQTLVAAANALDDPDPVPAFELARTYLATSLLPACDAEGFTLFPAIDGALGAPGATRVLVAQHRSLAAMVADIEKVGSRASEAGDFAPYRPYLVPLLHGLYAAARVHLESEEDILTGVMEERLSESQLATVCENYERITTRRPTPDHE